MLHRIATVGLLGSLIATPVLAQSSADADVEELMELYQASHYAMMAAVEGLTAEQWHFKAGPDRWSIAEVLEHIVLSDRWSHNAVSKELYEKAVTPEMIEAAKQQEVGVASTLADRSQKFQAPDFLVPSGSLGPPEKIMEALEEVRHDMMSFLESADFDLRSRYAPHVVLGEIDAHTWAVLVLEHGNRHLQQIEEVKASDGFPAIP